MRIVSRPVILAQNNQEARILVGSERPFVQVSRSLPTDAAVRDQVIQYRDVGTKLTITPTINADGYVNLQVLQEVSTATAETQFGAPVISTREASTHLFVKNGHTAVLGGLIDRQQEKTRVGHPGADGRSRWSAACSAASARPAPTASCSSSSRRTSSPPTPTPTTSAGASRRARRS